MDTQDKEPQVAPAMHVGAHVPVSREDLRERGDMAHEGKNAAQLEPQDTIRLKTIIDGKYDRPATWAQNLLCFHYGICRSPLTGGDDREQRSMHITTSEPPATPVSALVIRPNPASTWVVFDYRLVDQVDQAYIRVTGLDGRELARIPVNAAEGQPVYDTRQVAKGAYTVELVNGGKTIEKGKLIVQ